MIPYQLTTAGRVRLEVFNVLGQRVATLVDGERSAGFHTAAWDATDGSGQAVGAGVYIYRLGSDHGALTRRMVLLDGQAGTAAAPAPFSAVPTDAGERTYGLAVVGAGLATYVNAEFRVRPGMGPVEVVVDAAARGKALTGGILGDVNNDGQVDVSDAELVARYSGDSSVVMPNNGDIALGDVNGDGAVTQADALVILTYVANPADPSLPAGIGQPVEVGVLGDVNNDGQVDINDALLVTTYSGDSSVVMPNNGDIALGDVNGDGAVTQADALVIITYIANPADPALPARIGETVARIPPPAVLWTPGHYSTWGLPEGAVARLGKGEVREVAFSPDGLTLTVASGAGIWLYDVATGRNGHFSEAIRVGSIPFRFRPMAKPSPPGQRTARCCCGTWPVVRGMRRWKAIRVGSIPFRFRPMAKPSPPGQRTGTTVRWCCGTWPVVRGMRRWKAIRMGSNPFRFLLMGKPSPSGQGTCTTVRWCCGMWKVVRGMRRWKVIQVGSNPFRFLLMGKPSRAGVGDGFGTGYWTERWCCGMWKVVRGMRRWKVIRVGSIPFRFLLMGKPSPPGPGTVWWCCGMWKVVRGMRRWKVIRVGSIPFRFRPMGKPSLPGQRTGRCYCGMWKVARGMRRWKAIRMGSIPFRFRPMDKSSPPGHRTVWCCCGMWKVVRGMRRWKAIRVGSIPFRFRLMGKPSPPGPGFGTGLLQG